MTAVTPGQAAYEAFKRAEVSQLRSEKARLAALQGRGWQALSGDEQAWWIIAAHAGHHAYPADEAAIAAQQPQPAPGPERDALEDIARAAQGSIDASLPTDCDWFVSRAMEGLGWLPEGWPKAERPAPEPHRHPFAAGDCECPPDCECWRAPSPQPAPELAAAMAALADEIEAEAESLRLTGVTRGNRIRQDIAGRIRKALPS